MKTYVTMLAATALMGGTALIAQTGTADRTTNSGSPDQTFITKAAQGGMAEVKLGNLAKQHAQSQAVKDFAQRMVDDHTKANDELKSLASKEGVTLPTDLSAKDQALYDRLSKLNGTAFDKAYMRDMVADHHNDVTEFHHEATSGKDPGVKSWAGKTLATLQEHLKMAREDEKKVRSE